MEKKLIASIPLRRYQNIAVTPFAAWQENVGQRIFVINSDSMLEEFCHFPSPLRSGLRLSKVYWYQYNKIIARVYKENEEKYLICSRNMENSVFIPADVTYIPSSICMISEDMFLCNNYVYSFPDNQEIMRIPMENEEDYYVLFCTPLGNAQYIVVFEEKRGRNYRFKRIDIADKTIIHEIQINISGVLTPLGQHEFVCIRLHPQGVTMHFYDINLKEYKIIDIKEPRCCQTAVDHTENFIYVFAEGENKIQKIDYRSGDQESISIPEVKSNWLLSKAMNGFLYFMVSKKTMKVFDTNNKKLYSLTFNNKIIEFEIHNNYVFVLSGADADTDFKTDMLIKEGVIEVHQLIP